MPKVLEDKLKVIAMHKFPGDKEKQDAYIYGTMNNMGMMHGNKETEKGKKFDKKHKK